MAVDVLSTLNTGGSGLNISELSKDLAKAEIDPRRALVNERVDKAELSVTAFDRLGLQMQELGDTLNFAKGLQTLGATSDKAEVGALMLDPKLVPDTPVSVDVENIAQSQVLEFSGFTSADDVIGQGSLTVNFGKWEGEPPVFTENADKAGSTITFEAGSTLSDIAEALSSLDGVSARVIDLGDGSFSLGVNSDTGANNALRFSVGEGADAAMAGFDFASDPTAVQRREALDASLTVDGISVTRDSNEIDDLIPGMSLTLNQATTDGAAKVQASADPDLALGIMETYVDMFNQLKSLMNELTTRDAAAESDEAGALSGNVAASSLKREFDSLLTRGFEGFGDAPVYLSQMGVRTERDGRITLDETVFKDAFAEDATLFESVLRDGLRASDAGVSFEGTPSVTSTAGEYTFIRNPDTGDATLNGVALKGVEQEDGSTLYTVNDGSLTGVSLKVEAGVNSSTINFGKSISSTISDWATEALSDTGAVGRSEENLTSEIESHKDELEALDERALEIERRYLSRFTAMEQVVTQLNSTGDYLTNMVDSWYAE